MFEQPKIYATGLVKDEIYNRNMELIKTLNGHNQVMNGFIAMLTDMARGVLPPISEFSDNNLKVYFVVGTGNVSWDSNPTTPSATLKKLTHPIGYKEVSTDSIFLDTDLVNSANYGYKNFNFSAYYDFNECNDSLREFGIVVTNTGNPLFDCINGISGDVSSYLLEMYRHPKIDKTSDIFISRNLTISLHF